MTSTSSYFSPNTHISNFSIFNTQTSTSSFTHITTSHIHLTITITQLSPPTLPPTHLKIPSHLPSPLHPPPLSLTLSPLSASDKHDLKKILKTLRIVPNHHSKKTCSNIGDNFHHQHYAKMSQEKCPLIQTSPRSVPPHLSPFENPPQPL